jgi:hypothetical protein
VWAIRNAEVSLPVMVTLTYPAEYPTSGRVVKRHLHAFENWCRRRGVGGVWFLEFQDRGAPHLHLLVTRGLPPLEVSAAWYRIVASGDERHLRVGTRVEPMHSPFAWVYAAKYGAKAEQKDVPESFRDVGRFWGAWGEARTAPESFIVNRQAVRTMRRAYVAERRSWGPRWGRWRDRGRAGFRAYSCAGVARRLLGGSSPGARRAAGGPACGYRGRQALGVTSGRAGTVAEGRGPP